LFPVVDTPLGRLACIASEEILFPELARALTMRGAEVFLHSTSEVGSPRQTPKDIAKLARAIENLAFVVSANSASITGIDIPAASTDGKSQIVDFNGRVLVEAGTGESMVANAEIDVEALRRARNRPGMPNLVARNRFELWAHEYARAAEAGLGHPASNIDPAEIPERSHFIRIHSAVIERLQTAGVIA
jgi:deaminated glutathione amidase